MGLQDRPSGGKGIEMRTLVGSLRVVRMKPCLLIAECLFVTVIASVLPLGAASFEDKRNGRPVSELQPGNGSTVDELIERGRKYSKDKNFELAVETFTRALQSGKYSFNLYIDRSRAYVGLKRYQEALADALFAIEINPNNSLGYAARGLVYFYTDRSKESIADFTRAIDLSPSVGQYHAMRGDAYFDLGEAEKALNDFSSAIRLGVSNATVFRHRALAYRRLGRYDEALRDLTEALRRDPSHVGSLTHRGSVYRCLDQYQLAKADLDRVLDLQPNDLEARLQRAFVALDADDFPSALEDLRFAESKRMKDVHLFLSLAYASYRLGHVTEALKANGQALELATQKIRPGATLQRAVLLLVQDKTEEARRLFEEGRLLAQEAKDLDALDDALDDLKRLQKESSISPDFLKHVYGELKKTHNDLPQPGNRPHGGCQARK